MRESYQPDTEPQITIGDVARANVLAGLPATANLPGYQVAAAPIDARTLVQRPQPKSLSDNIDDAMDKLNYSKSFVRDGLRTKMQKKGEEQ